MLTRYNTVNVKMSSVKNTLTNNYSGYKTYYSLFKKCIQMAKDKNVFTTKLYLSFLFQLWFKPLKQFYSKVTLIKGDYKVINGVFENISVAKMVTHKLFSIPFYIESPKLNKEDIKELLK